MKSIFFPINNTNKDQQKLTFLNRLPVSILQTRGFVVIMQNSVFVVDLFLVKAFLAVL